VLARHCADWVALLLLIRISELHIMPQGLDRGYVDTGFCGFPQNHETHSRLLPKIRPQSLPSTYFPVRYSLIIILLNSVYSELSCHY
jgi:hypothetical protein